MPLSCMQLKLSCYVYVTLMPLKFIKLWSSLLKLNFQNFFNPYATEIYKTLKVIVEIELQKNFLSSNDFHLVPQMIINTK